MRISRIYQDLPLSPGATVEPEDRAAHYIARVLRLRVGDCVHLFDGRGVEVCARVTQLGKKNVILEIESRVESIAESTLDITLMLGLSRGERMDYAIQKAVELGVTCIQPVITEFAAFAPKAAQIEKKMQHWQGVMISACEQCGRSHLPRLAQLQGVQQYLTTGVNVESDFLGLLFSPNAGQSMLDVKPVQKPVVLAVGPEGGLSEREEQQLLAAGFQGVRLGPRILRTETAAVAVMSAAQLLWGDLV